MQYTIKATENILEFDIHEDINLVQGESNADIFTIILPLQDGHLDLTEMTYTLKGTVGSIEMREVLPKTILTDAINLEWSPNGAWTANYGTLRLTLIASDSKDVVAKWVAPEGLLILEDYKGKNNKVPEDVAYQLLYQMQDLVGSLDTGNIKIPHSSTLQRDESDAHPIESITGLREELDSKTSVVLRQATFGNLLTLSEESEIVDSGHCCSDFVLKEELDEVLSNVDADKSCVHRQESASNEWHIHHTLNKMPSVTVVDSSGNVVMGDISYKDANYIVVRFNGSFSGRCYLS